MKTINCNLCGSRNFKIILESSDIRHQTSHKIFTLVKCKDCKLVFLNPQPEENEIQESYPHDYLPHQEKRSPLVRPSKILRLIYKMRQAREDLYGSGSKNVLDIGCGSGKALAKLYEKYPQWNFYGVETSSEAAKIARSRNINVFEGELKNAQYPNHFFDLVLMEHVFEHVTDPKALLKEVSRILKKDGIVRISVPNFRSLERVMFGKYWQAYEIPRHLYFYTSKTMKIYLRGSGLNMRNLTFHSSPKYFLESFSLWKNGIITKNYSPLIWLTLWPLAKIISILGLSSTMKIEAKK